MRLQLSKTKNATSLYIVKSTYDKNGKRSNKVVKKLGTLAAISEIYEDPIAWGNEVAKRMTEQEKEDKNPITVTYDPTRTITNEHSPLYNGGYLFLQKIYYELGLNKICKKISKKYKFEYDLNDILSKLIYGRILFPGSKASTFEDSRRLLEGPEFEQHDIYRALEVLNNENDLIQSELYKNSKDVISRNDSILYYDCTNFFFETEEEDEIRKYGVSKEHRPNPIVQMGMFMDADGIPLAYNINPGNTSEQTTLKPLEKQIMRDFGKAQFVICTDSGMSSLDNRKFNAIQGRFFITTLSLKKVKDYQRNWALDPKGWHLSGSDEVFDLENILASAELSSRYYDAIFYKENLYNNDGLNERYVVTFSLKYKNYMEQVRARQINRAIKKIENGTVSRKRENDPSRYIGQCYFTDDGTIAENSVEEIDTDAIANDAKYDGFYCVTTNLNADVNMILRTNAKRWEIEESFRIMKTDFRSRPVYLQREDRIRAHFLTCFLALYIYRILEKRLEEKYTTDQILDTLRNMKFLRVRGEGFIPLYTRTEITDAIHAISHFNTDFEIIPVSSMKNIYKISKSVTI